VRSMVKTLIAMLVISVAAVASAQSNAASSESQGCGASASARTAAGFNQRSPRYEIETGDSFDLNFEFVPGFNQTLIVQPDGFVSLRGIGDVKVAGKTVPELTRDLCRDYGKIMVSPELVVILKDFDKPYFVATGQVQRPGKYDLRGNTTLTEAIAEAGGFTEKSKHSQVLLFRRVSDKWSEARVIDVKKMLHAKDLEEDPVLQAGDMIVVPQNRISKIARFLPTPSLSTYVNPTQF
jgi:polysaccharide biosynthesis/export protein